MKITDVSVKNPVATYMVYAAIVLFGFLAIFRLPRDLFPDIELPTLTVITVYPGANAEQVEKEVTNPLEIVLASTENIKKFKVFQKIMYLLFLCNLIGVQILARLRLMLEIS